MSDFLRTFQTTSTSNPRWELLLQLAQSFTRLCKASVRLRNKLVVLTCSSMGSTITISLNKLPQPIDFATHTLGGASRETHHVGYRNVAAYLRRLVSTFPMADRVLVTGSSAGGYGALVNWEQFANAFPRARVDMIDDSGPPLQPNATTWAAWRAAWDLHLPAGCSTCATDLGAVVPYYATRFPAPARFALLSYTQDSTISGYYTIPAAQFEMQLNALATARFDPTSNGKYFFVAGMV